MSAVSDHGRQYGALTVISIEGWFRRVRCICGTEKLIRSDHLKRVKSCGCRGSAQLARLRSVGSDEKTCDYCGAQMLRGAYGREYWATRRYCSNACHTKARNDSRETLFWQRVRKVKSPNGCWLWAGNLDKDGYGRVTYHGVTERAHRKAYELVCGAIPDGLLLRHSCDNPRCVNPRHLTVGTVADNSADMVDRGRAAVRIGGLNTAAKLSESQARAIFADTRHHREIACEYGVSSETVWDIKSGRSWAHLRLRESRQ